MRNGMTPIAMPQVVSIKGNPWVPSHIPHLSHNQNPGKGRFVRDDPSANLAADIRLLSSLHGSGSTIFVPGFDCDSPLVHSPRYSLALPVVGFWKVFQVFRRLNLNADAGDAVPHPQHHL